MDIEKMQRLAEGTSGVGPHELAQIKKATSRNDHQGALILGAAALGATQLKKKLELVKQLHTLEGSMPSSLGAYRDQCYKDLLALAKQKLSAKDYDAFYGSF